MRSITSLKDAEIGLKYLEDQIRLLSTGDLDFKQRRIKNASPSQSPNDYVVRRELLQAVQGQQSARADNPVIVGGDFTKGVFGLGINRDLVIGDDVCPRHIVTAPVDSGWDAQAAKITRVYAQSVEYAVGADIKFECWRDLGGLREIKLFDMTIAEQDDTVNLLEVVDMDEVDLIDSDTISFNLTQIGSSVSGRRLYVAIVYKWQS